MWKFFFFASDYIKGKAFTKNVQRILLCFFQIKKKILRKLLRNVPPSSFTFDYNKKTSKEVKCQGITNNQRTYNYLTPSIMVGENHEFMLSIFDCVFWYLPHNKARNAYLILLRTRIRVLMHYAMCSFSLYMNETQEKCDTFVFYGSGVLRDDYWNTRHVYVISLLGIRSVFAFTLLDGFISPCMHVTIFEMLFRDCERPCQVQSKISQIHSFICMSYVFISLDKIIYQY